MAVIVAVRVSEGLGVGLGRRVGGCVGWSARSGVGGSVPTTTGITGSAASVGIGSVSGWQAARLSEISATIRTVLINHFATMNTG